MKFDFVFSVVWLLSTSVVSVASSCNIDDDKEYRVHLDNVSIQFDLKPNGEEMSDKEKDDVLTEYIRRLNSQNKDGGQIMDILSGDATDDDDSNNNSTRRELGEYVQVWRQGSNGQWKLVTVYCESCGRSKCYRGKRRLTDSDILSDLPVTITKKGDPEPGSADAALIAFSNAKVVLDSTKDVCELARKKKRSISDDVSKLVSELKEARTYLMTLKNSMPGSKDAIEKQKETIHKMVENLRKTKSKHSAARAAMSESCQTCVPKARKALSKAKKLMAGLKLNKKYVQAFHSAVQRADQANHKMRKQN